MQPQQMEKPIPKYFINPSLSSPMIITNTVIVFDFDDTLFPTKKFKEINSRSNTININTCNSTPNYSAQPLISRMSLTELNQFIELSWATLNLLTIYINRYSHKNICIVSASTNGWVQDALKSVYDIGYFKQIYALIFGNYNISTFNPTTNIIKSFGLKKSYKSHDDHPCVHWKYHVFKFILAQKCVDSVDGKNHNTEVINSFVFIGDSIFEYLAANKLRMHVCAKDKNKNVFIHRIRLKRKPEINELIKEHKYLYSRCASFEQYSMDKKSGFDVDCFEEIEKERTKTEQDNE